MGDIISLSIGLGSIALAILTIFATLRSRNTPFTAIETQDIEMQPLFKPRKEYEIALRSMETVLRLFRTGA